MELLQRWWQAVAVDWRGYGIRKGASVEFECMLHEPGFPSFKTILNSYLLVLWRLKTASLDTSHFREGFFFQSVDKITWLLIKCTQSDTASKAKPVHTLPSRISDRQNEIAIRLMSENQTEKICLQTVAGLPAVSYRRLRAGAKS